MIYNQAIDGVYSSTAQYKEDNLEKYGCAPSGDFVKDNDAKAAAGEDCVPGPDCEIFGSKCCEVIPPPVSPCDDNSPECRLLGVGCCEDNSILNESPCVPDEESCETFGEGEKAEEEQVFGDRQRNSGLLMTMAFCIESPQVYVTAN